MSQGNISGEYLRGISQGNISGEYLRGISQGNISGEYLRGISQGVIGSFQPALPGQSTESMLWQGEI
jgi:hypothetical protein